MEQHARDQMDRQRPTNGGRQPPYQVPDLVTSMLSFLMVLDGWRHVKRGWEWLEQTRLGKTAWVHTRNAVLFFGGNRKGRGLRLNASRY